MPAHPPQVSPVIDNTSLQPDLNTSARVRHGPIQNSQTMATDCHRNLLLRSNANLLFILLQRPEKVIHRRGVHSGPAVAGEVALRVDTKIEPKKISRPDFRSRLNLS